MKIQMVAGGELDVVTGDELRQGLNETHDRLIKRLPSADRGIRKKVVNSQSFPSGTGTFVLDMGSPPSGMLWWLQEVCYGCVDDHTTLATSFAALYIGHPPGSSGTNIFPALPSLGELQRPGQAIPGSFPFSGEAVPVQDQENLYIVFYIGTATTQVYANATVVEISNRAVQIDTLPSI